MLCSVVIPIYNEEENLQYLYQKLIDVLEEIGCDRQLIFVDDCSNDNSLEIIKKLSDNDKTVNYVSFSRNFGHEIATTAGIDRAKGDVVILIDADLQDPPELIKEMISKWEEGYRIVHAKRRRRGGESFYTKFTSWAFYRVFQKITDFKIPADTGDFSLMDKSVVEKLRMCNEKNRFMRGLINWVGFKHISIEFDRKPRFGGKSKYNNLKRFMLSIEAISGFSIIPLRIATILGLIVTFLSFSIAIIIVIQKFFLLLTIPGYALLTTGVFFLGGVQMLLLGALGEYIGRIYIQVQNRPLYIVKEEK